MRSCAKIKSSRYTSIFILLVIANVIYYFLPFSDTTCIILRHLPGILSDSTSVKNTTTDNEPCEFPITATFPKFFQDWDPTKGYKNCSHEQNLYIISDDGDLTLNSNDTCCIQNIVRGTKDSLYTTSTCEPLESPANISDRESFVVQCGNRTNLDAWCPDKPAVDKKIQYWTENFPDLDDRPYSVLFFGFDTVSRAHAYRSLPKSLKLMREELNFVDFTAYHSIAGSTLANFMGFLMGMPRQEVRQICAKTWQKTFDACPFIWKNYNESHYVTSFVEDGPQSFNWGGNGFIKAPTDYYIHHFFRKLRQLRAKEKQKFKLKKTREDCVSEDPVPTFHLRYMRRFLVKFQEIPFFHFTWFAYPFHNSLNYLHNFDEDLLEFLQFLQRSPRILRKTLIVMVSDHGDRYQFYSPDSTESFVERVAPPFFIRLPDQLAEERPEMVDVVKRNSEHLSTPYDIHHTFLHLLHLKEEFLTENNDTANNNNTQLGDTKKFLPVLPDRSSVLESVPMNRSCASTNIPGGDCLCNIQYDGTAGKKLSKEFADIAVDTAAEGLVDMVDRYKHGKKCKTWTLNKRSNPDFAVLLRAGENYREVLVPFKMNEGGATFQGRVKVFVTKCADGKDKPVSAKVVGIRRINTFGSQSTCLPGITDEDKGMKEFCFCRGRKN